MENGTFPLINSRPVAIVGAGPVGLTTALALAYHNIPFIIFEAHSGLSTETKAGTTLTRTLEIWHRFGAAEHILTRSMRVDEIGDIERETNRSRNSVKLHLLKDETRFPFVINLPQHLMEPALRDCLAMSGSDRILYRHQLTNFTSTATGLNSKSIPRTVQRHSKPAISWHATAAGAQCAIGSASPSRDARSPNATRWST